MTLIIGYPMDGFKPVGITAFWVPPNSGLISDQHVTLVYRATDL